MLRTLPMASKSLKLGLIGSGFMGKAHVFGFATAERVFDLPYSIEMDTIADVTPERADIARYDFGFRKSTGNWHDLIADPEIDIIDITAPNALHYEMALAAIHAGKHVYCEKPLAPRTTEALEMCRAAKISKVRTQVGFNYLANPLFALARNMIASGQLGKVTHIRSIHSEDYMSDPASPWTFRHDSVGGGVLADLGSHALATAEYLLGPIDAVLGHTTTVYNARPHCKGMKPVSVEDHAVATLKFASGAVGSLEASWLSTGEKMQHDFAIYGTKGALKFTQDRLNELQYFNSSDPSELQGFKTIVAGPDHKPYDRFCVAPGHQLGFNDLKAIEIYGFIKAIAGLHPEPFNFQAGLRVQTLVETILKSSKQGGWLDIPQIAA